MKDKSLCEGCSKRSSCTRFGNVYTESVIVIVCIDYESCSPKSDEEVIGEVSTNFSSRFKPNVKFDLMINETMVRDEIYRLKNIIKKIDELDDNYCAFITNEFGEIVYKYSYSNLSLFNIHPLPKVSIYEAIIEPNLVPDGFVYDKEQDKLVSYAEYMSKDFDEKIEQFSKNQGTAKVCGLEYAGGIDLKKHLVVTPPVFGNKYDREIKGKDGKSVLLMFMMYLKHLM